MSCLVDSGCDIIPGDTQYSISGTYTQQPLTPPLHAIDTENGNPRPPIRFLCVCVCGWAEA